jgi:hypothetical protein
MRITAKLTKDERSLLLYLETRLVDHYGRVNGLNIKIADMAIIEKRKDAEFVNFGRICSDDISTDGSLWVTFSDGAWRSAHAERRARADRMQLQRSYRTTEEKRARVEK